MRGKQGHDETGLFRPVAYVDIEKSRRRVMRVAFIACKCRDSNQASYCQDVDAESSFHDYFSRLIKAALIIRKRWLNARSMPIPSSG